MHDWASELYSCSHRKHKSLSFIMLFRIIFTAIFAALCNQTFAFHATSNRLAKSSRNVRNEVNVDFHLSFCLQDWFLRLLISTWFPTLHAYSPSEYLAGPEHGRCGTLYWLGPNYCPWYSDGAPQNWEFYCRCHWWDTHGMYQSRVPLMNTTLPYSRLQTIHRFASIA